MAAGEKLFSVSWSKAIQFTVQLEVVTDSMLKVLRLSVRVILSISKSHTVLSLRVVSEFLDLFLFWYVLQGLA